MTKLVLLPGGLSVCAVLFACASSRAPRPAATELEIPRLDAAAIANEDAGPASYSSAAASTYEAGLDSMAREHWDDAIAAFSECKKSYAYSRYAKFAELRIADIAFAREQWLEAAEQYRTWARYHPSEPAAESVKRRAALAACRAEGGHCDADTYAPPVP